MSEPIKVGDLVMVVKPPPCGCTRTVGWIFTVQSFGRWTGYCNSCKSGYPISVMAESGIPWVLNTYAFSLDRLKRIPPLSELDDVKQDEEITA